MANKVSDDRITEVFNNYIKTNKCVTHSKPLWTINTSSLGGRGLIAVRDIARGELLYIDPPLVLGPRSELKCTPVCVGCHRVTTLHPCSKGCGLPVCGGRCEDTKRHAAECKTLHQWRKGVDSMKPPVDWSPALLTMLTPIRCLLLADQDREILECLEGHPLPQHTQVIEFLQNNLNNGPMEGELLRVRRGCEVLDAVAYETLCPQGLEDKSGSLRGIYPIAALMNHSCTPNTRHCFDGENNMVVEACKDIKAGEEVTTTYTSLVWGNQSRKIHLQLTKRFQCRCSRCLDPQEFGAKLMALYCLHETCPGVLLPSTEGGKWTCSHCDMKIKESKMSVVNNALRGIIATIDINNPRRAVKLLQHRTVIPNCNQLAVELKISINWIYGHHPGFLWADLSNEDIDLKEVLCRELLMLLDVLQLGDCRLKGLFLYELYLTLSEKTKRRLKPVNIRDSIGERLSLTEVLQSADILFLLKEAATILHYDTAADNIKQDYQSAVAADSESTQYN